MSRWLAKDIPLGQKNWDDVKVIGKTIGDDGEVTLSWSSGQVTVHAPDEEIRDVCCGSCRAAGTYSRKWGNVNDRVTRRAARDTERQVEAAAAGAHDRLRVARCVAALSHVCRAGSPPPRLR